ncbi:hypothetical protein BJF83_24930 [Nocardiopsis sp. CNR-923]|nr:hypothetical protein BJF83_24930 [Nocardiopsis sp. CNR-923]
MDLRECSADAVNGRLYAFVAVVDTQVWGLMQFRYIEPFTLFVRRVVLDPISFRLCVQGGFTRLRFNSERIFNISYGSGQSWRVILIYQWMGIP